MLCLTKLSNRQHLQSMRFYNLPEETVQMEQLSKVLIALEQVGLLDFKGMSLDEIRAHTQG